MAREREEVMPTRIQRRRKKGWRMPLGTICVGRPGPWSNPFDSAEEFRVWLRGQAHQDLFLERRHWILANLDLLRQYRYVACWCRLDRECHADVLLELLASRN
jgi:hypothetical protein